MKLRLLLLTLAAVIPLGAATYSDSPEIATPADADGMPLETDNPVAYRYWTIAAQKAFWDLRYAPLGSGGTGDVTAANPFATDNAIIRSDGTGKGVQSTGVLIDDSNNMTGIDTVVVTTTNATSLSLGGTAITATGEEINHLVGVTAPVQNQLDAKIDSDVTEGLGLDAVLNIVSCTQAEYDALTPVATTFYIITDAP